MSDYPRLLVSVWLPLPRRRVFTYALPKGTDPPAPGALVLAPMGRRKVVGLVAELGVPAPEGVTELKEILSVLPEGFALRPPLLRVFRWAVGHYLTPPGEVLRTFLPPALFKDGAAKGERARQRPPVAGFAGGEPPALTEAQQVAIAEVLERSDAFHAYLLHGITGSGKTEVYLRLCEEVLRRGRSALILVPEIALTPQTLGRFAARFGEGVAAYHSGMTEAQRLQVWWGAKEGRVRVAVGTRSALCLPFPDLGILVVDEEHDASYKQEERFRYHARDLAVVRAKEEGIPVVLGSATPSVETLENAGRGKYRLLQLPDRATAGQLPRIHLVDLKTHPADPETLLTAPLAAQLDETLRRGEQALLFLNRRGFAPFLLCCACGEAPRCPNCEISLTYHKRPTAMVCHYCEFQSPPPQACAKCGSEELRAMGTGTERLEEALQKRYPELRLARLDRDVASGRQRTEEILSSFAAGELDVLVGTQLVAKGHDFKRLTLVGVLLADSTLHQPDFRAAERLFQLVTQVAGRAGRHDLPGEVFLQTFRPEHYAIVSALGHDLEGFFARERAQREEVGYPPFQRVVLLKLSGSQADRVERACGKLAEDLAVLFGRHPELRILGPAPAALAKLRGRYRWQVMLRTPKFEAMRRLLEEKLPYFEEQLPPGVALHVDVDPIGVF
ncbi:MAG: primosomal protein N' [Deltaproteobacteria bacterium]|nr:primosomal protein N' [Deltaproteobacteria bacterium]